MLKEAKGTHGINSGGTPNNNMASDFSTPQFHAINIFFGIIFGFRMQL